MSQCERSVLVSVDTFTMPFYEIGGLRHKGCSSHSRSSSAGKKKALPLEGLSLRRDWLPEPDAPQNGCPLIYEFAFGVLNVRKGEKHLLLHSDAEARRAAKARKPQALSIQHFLQQAIAFQARLRADKALKRATLAREAGITPTRLTQILHLLQLSPDIRRTILALNPTGARGPSERWLRTIAMDQDLDSQAQRFNQLLKEVR